VVNAVAVDPTTPSTVYAGTDAGGYKTIPKLSGGFKWATNNALVSRRIYALLLDPVSASTVYAGTDGGLFKSTDGGLSWTPVTNGLTATGIYSLLADPAAPSTFYAGTDGGVFKSTDRGASWVAMNQGLSNLVVNTVALASTSPPGPYAGTAGGSVFVFGRPEASVCMADGTTLCLSANRFRVSADYEKSNGAKGPGHAVPLTDDTGYFWFFDPTNIEVVTKVLPFCANPFNSIWVFAAGLTDVQVTLTYTDTKNGTVVTKSNPQGVAFVPIQDTQAFLTCP
jgi:ligand-binding sensor domain-containing protein